MRGYDDWLAAPYEYPEGKGPLLEARCGECGLTAQLDEEGWPVPEGSWDAIVWDEAEQVLTCCGEEMTIREIREDDRPCNCGVRCVC